MLTLTPGRLIPGCQFWCEARDADPECRAIARRHYSAKKNPNPRTPKFVGPGFNLVLVSPLADALFTWRKCEFRADGQTGIECTIFRNESNQLSSSMIREADRLADKRWPGKRHFTYVDGSEVRSTNPGYCFVAAGWSRCGVSKKGLILLERRIA